MSERIVSAMHRCLAIPYLLTIIFENVVEDTQEKWPRPGSSTLAALAVTCQLFNEPALKVLWRFLPSLEPLVRCLPPHTFCFHKTPKSSEQLHISREIQSKDFERAAYYGAMVRILGDPSPRCRLPKAQFHPLVIPVLLSRGNTPRPLLPNLRHINVGIDEFRDQAVYPQLIMGPNIRSIVITIQGHPTDNYPWDNIRETLCKSPTSPSAPHAITSFKIVMAANDAQFLPHPDLLHVICSLQRLQVLSIPHTALTHASLSELSTFSDLTELDVMVKGDEIMQYIQMGAKGMSFPALTRLQLRTDDLRACGRLLELPGFQKLDSLRIRRLTNNSVWDMDHFFDTIKVRNSLTSLEISGPMLPWTLQGTNISPVTARTIEPLLSFTNLTKLFIDVDTFVQIDNECLKRMAEAWPRLQCLCLEDRSQGIVTNATLAGLIPLARSCQNLEELTLRVDAARDIPGFAKLGAVTACSSLRSFYVCTSPVKNPTQVAIFLQLLFPYLSEVWPGWLYDGGDDLIEPNDPLEIKYLDCWQDVVQLLRECDHGQHKPWVQ
ncbi:hypothetical protein Hypma_001758 [Hypsizygus marmoreus]|uniref:Uncharacterized protein n=1 Tax=Hypsizygus marmoreus TaxID=39966 RepID=A0A369JD97_HYPMA|nr:hypothetical protein Hypma_001758 [Hypsizygus marmoreus]